ncbi:14380_t:CDS:2 [Dentiscutata heterogama]|uniref:14380_t:CDS:1 n=1 Tax=Dentiscutata heterogama TaxID=1316150 RepID=A0ACA9JUW3_9GLOM|nr:14380_t:CDS:2 [Dentiscutata heterogama]
MSSQKRKADVPENSNISEKSRKLENGKFRQVTTRTLQPDEIEILLNTKPYDLTRDFEIKAFERTFPNREDCLTFLNNYRKVLVNQVAIFDSTSDLLPRDRKNKKYEEIKQWKKDALNKQRSFTKMRLDFIMEQIQVVEDKSSSKEEFVSINNRLLYVRRSLRLKKVDPICVPIREKKQFYCDNCHLIRFRNYCSRCKRRRLEEYEEEFLSDSISVTTTISFSDSSYDVRYDPQFKYISHQSGIVSENNVSFTDNKLFFCENCMSFKSSNYCDRCKNRLFTEEDFDLMLFFIPDQFNDEPIGE